MPKQGFSRILDTEKGEGDSVFIPVYAVEFVIGLIMLTPGM
jgi:hypothetical protein